MLDTPAVTRPRSALALLAHADDESLGCGGTLAFLAASGWDVQVLLLTDGLVTARGGEVLDNRASCVAACARMGIAPATFLGYPDQQLERSTVTDLSNAVLGLGLEPDLIITHSADDLNADHRITAEVARIVSRPTQRPTSVLACEVPADAFWNGRPFRAGYFVNIAEHLQAKLEAYACYERELAIAPEARKADAIRALALHHGAQVGVPAAEAFEVVRAVAGTLP